MSVGFANAVVEGLRFNGVRVTFEPGWETRGNGYSFPNGKPEGLITHHTGAEYDSGLSVLIHGRVDLQGPLCNCSTRADGTIHIIAAHPANHAGASGGPSMGPLPVTSLFNPRVWGNEVMFPGIRPWTVAQYRSSRVLAGVICGILKRPSPEWARGHSETSLTRKWDPGLGQGSGVSFPMKVFRTEIWSALQPVVAPVVWKEDEMLSWDISGKGRRVITCPTGAAAANNRKSWLSATVIALNGAGWIRVFAQSDVEGVHDWLWTERELAPVAPPINRVRRQREQIKSPTSHLVVVWDLSNAPEGATLTLETIA